jgi:hypothetical protein
MALPSCERRRRRIYVRESPKAMEKNVALESNELESF